MLNKYSKNIFLTTTIAAIIGTLVYTLIVYFFYASYISYRNVAIFFVVIWVVYYLFAKFSKKKY